MKEQVSEEQLLVIHLSQLAAVILAMELRRNPQPGDPPMAELLPKAKQEATLIGALAYEILRAPLPPTPPVSPRN